MSAPVIQFKRGQFANLPALRAGEPGFTTDSYDLYVGINSTTNGNKFFGSHRYWTKETATTGSGVNLVEGSNNGSNIITLKAPNNVTSDVTYTFPAAAVDGGYLRVDSTGKLAWESALNATGVSTATFLQATTVNVSAAATIPTLSGTTATFTNITANGGLNGNLNATGVSTVTYLQNTNINSTGIHTASSFSGSGSGLSAGTVPILALDIDGATSAASVAGTDLFIIDSGANGTNRKATAQQVSQYILGGSGGATLPALLVTGLSTFSGNVTASAGVSGNLNATGVSTAAFLQATNVNASGIVTASSFVGPLTGNSSTATTLQTSRNFSASGDATASAVSFNGSSNVDLALTLASSGVSAGTYGSQTQVPVVTVDTKGRVTSVTTAAVGTALTVTGDSGSEQINLLSEALSISGGTNLTSVASNNGVVINLDNDINLTTITASQVKATGIVTASSFSGSLANTLTLGTSGTGLSGSTTFNNSGAATFTVTSNATSANTASAVVARDASGNFSAGTVTAVGGFAGNVNATGVSTAAFLQATNVNASGIVTAATLSGSLANTLTLGTSGTGLSGSTTFNNSGAATFTVTSNATSANTASAVVARDASGNFSAGTVTAALTGNVTGNVNATGVSTAAFLQATTVNASGIVTASQFSTGVSGTGINISASGSTGTISGPSTLVIDPSGVGDNTGTVRIKGDFMVDGTQTIINSSVIDLADFRIGIGTTATTDTILDGSGIGIGQIGSQKTFTWSNSSSALKSSEHLDVASGKVYKVNGTEVLSGTNLAAGIGVSGTSLDIDGITAASSVVGTDLFIIDSGANGTNRKATAQQVSQYILGGSGGATLPALLVTGLSTFSGNVTASAGVSGNFNATGVSTAAYLQNTNINSTGIHTAATFSGSLQNTLTLNTSGTGLSGSTTFNNSGAATFTVTSNATSANTVSAVVARDASGNFSAGTVTAALTGNVTGNINSTGISTASFLQASTVNASGIVTAASFRGTDIRKTDGSLIPLVGVNSASGNAGLVTSFKFTGTGLDSFSVVNGVANISYTGVAATTYTTSQTIVATAGQTSFTVSAGYQQGYVDVYLNGIRLISGVDYTAQDPAGSVVTLASGATLNDELEFVIWKSLGDVVNIANLKTTGNLTVTGFTTTTNTFRSSGGAVLSGVTTANSVQVTDLNSTGIVTASSFSGALANTLTLGTSGTGLSGSTTFNNSGAATFTVTSNATSANTSSAVVARDASGNFSAGTVTAALTGNVTGNVTGNLNSTGVSTVTYLQNTNINSTGIHTAATFSGSLANTLTLNTSGTGLSGSTTFNNSGAATFTVTSNATSANTASAVVARDASGNFSAGTITANLTGTASNVTTNANLTGDITSVGNATSIAAGVIVDADINASAAIADTKLATIATAGKVSNSATTATSSNTASAIVARDASGNFSAGTISATDITLTGNLTVNGTTTQVNTTTLTIEDNLVEFGKIDNAAPTTTTTVDLGLIFHYFTGSAKKSSIFWDQSASRMVLASEMTEGSSPSVVNATTYAALEIGSLWLNDCAGQQQVISCSGTTRSLNDITIDGGSF